MLLEYIDSIPATTPASERSMIRKKIILELDDIEIKMQALRLDMMRESLRRPGLSRF